MSNCIFCKIINKEIPGKIIYEDDVCIAFLDLSQATYGHTLVIPKKHFENILEVDAQTLAHVMQVTQKLAKQIVEKLNAKGLNILTNTNEVAGQNDRLGVCLQLGYQAFIISTFIFYLDMMKKNLLLNLMIIVKMLI